MTEEEVRQYKWALLTHLARGYAKRDWAMQLHFAAQRDNNHRMHRLLGPDTGYDSIGPGVNLPALAAFLDGLDETGELPRTILYSLEPSDNAALVALMGCFQGPGTAGRLQHGSAWWFNDHKPGMEAQLTTLAAGGLLGNFIGMLTDSRSFLSYTRHEYFRRILCNRRPQMKSPGVPAKFCFAGRTARSILLSVRATSSPLWSNFPCRGAQCAPALWNKKSSG